MKLCMVHPHSSRESAARCYGEWLGRKADRKIGKIPQAAPPRIVAWTPPRSVWLGAVEMFVFQEDLNTPYENRG